MHPPTRLWSRDLVLAILTNLFISLVYYLLVTSMALYAIERFGASDAAAGLAASSFLIGAILARLFGGLVDVAGRRRTLVVGLVAFTLLSYLYIPNSSLGGLLLVRFGHGVAFGAANTALSTAVQGLIPAERRGEGTGYYGLSTTLSTAVGPFLAVVLSASGDYESIFWFCTAASAAALAVALTVRIPERRRPRYTAGAAAEGAATPESAAALTAARPAHGRRRRWLPRASSFVEPAALPVSLVILLCGLAYSGIVAYLAAYAVEEQLGAVAGVYFIVYAAAVLVARLFMGRLQDRRGDNAAAYPSLVAFALGLGVLAVQPTVATIVVAAALTGFGFGAIMPCLQAVAVKESPEARMGLATSTFYLVLDAGIGFGPVLLGAFLPLTGYVGMYAGLAVLVAATVGVYFLVHGRKRRGPAAPRP